MPSHTLEIPQNSPLHRKLSQRLSSRWHLAEQGHQTRYGRWQKAEELTLAFLPETNEDIVRRGRRNSGEVAYTTIQVPYSYALLMSAHTYWTSVFFARNPIHQYSGRHGEGEMQIQAMEALIGYQIEVGAATGPYYIWFYDAGKYGCGVLGHYWEERKLHYGSLVEVADPLTGKTSLYQTTQEIAGYKGNRVYNVSPWDFMPDPRVPLKRFQEGEFFFVRQRLGWNQILRRRDAGYFDKNVDNLKITSLIRIFGREARRSNARSSIRRFMMRLGNMDVIRRVPFFGKFMWNLCRMSGEWGRRSFRRSGASRLLRILE